MATKELTDALQQASRDLQGASAEGANAARKLNGLTIVLAIAAGLSVLIGGWQGWQTKRQADVAEAELKKKAASSPEPSPRSNPGPITTTK